MLIFSFLIDIGIWFTFGPIFVLIHLCESFVSVFLLEDVNYIEHYGLKRKFLPDGSIENIKPIHSWNADHVVSNCVTLNLQRHSDHHTNSFKAFQCLKTVDDAPQLPTGYAGMMILALVPPLFFHVMNPIVKKWNSE
jgi:alkane 1-monooxygenase